MEQNHQYWKWIVTGLTVALIVVFVLIISYLLKPFTQFSPNEKVVPVFHQTFHKDGILFEKNGLLHFIDAKSGKDIVLCDKPNCLHEGWSINNPQPTCNAAIDGNFMDGYAIYGDQLFFTAQTDRGGVFSKEVYKADINGTNRKQIAELTNVQFGGNVSFVDGFLLFPYINQNDPDSPDVDMEQPIVGVAAVNLSTHAVTYTPTKKGYNPSIWRAHVYEGKIYYTYTYLDIKTNEDETVDVQQHFFVEVYCYDPATETETKLIGGNGLTFLGYDGSYAYLVEQTEKRDRIIQMNLVNGEKTVLFEEDNMRASFFVDGDNLIYSIDVENGLQWKLFDTKTQISQAIGDAIQFDASDSFIIDAVIEDKVYISYTDSANGEFCNGYLSKQDFYDGQFDKRVPLLYPNEE